MCIFLSSKIFEKKKTKIETGGEGAQQDYADKDNRDINSDNTDRVYQHFPGFCHQNEKIQVPGTNDE